MPVILDRRVGLRYTFFIKYLWSPADLYSGPDFTITDLMVLKLRATESETLWVLRC